MEACCCSSSAPATESYCEILSSVAQLMELLPRSISDLGSIMTLAAVCVEFALSLCCCVGEEQNLSRVDGGGGIKVRMNN